MCWSSNKLVKKIAEESFFGYKLLIPKSKTEDAISTILRYPYKKDVENPEISLEPLIENDSYIIEEGYHSYMYFPVSYYSSYDVYLVEIPKGAVYYESEEDKEIVSSQIILRKRLTYNGRLSFWNNVKLLFGMKIKYNGKVLDI